MSLWDRCVECGVSYLHILPVIKIVYYIVTLVIFTAVQESESVQHFQILTGKHSILNQVQTILLWNIQSVKIVLCRWNSVRYLLKASILLTLLY